jgi:hypothetical protein
MDSTARRRKAAEPPPVPPGTAAPEPYASEGKTGPPESAPETGTPMFSLGGRRVQPESRRTAERGHPSRGQAERGAERERG